MNRFWSKINPAPTDCCWEWLRGKFEDGYGKFYYEGRNHGAHRVAYLLTKGKIDDGLIVRHTCDNPSCCNPNHLILGTYQDNINDKVKRNRQAKGEKNASTKLSSKQVKEIFLSKKLQKELAKEFNVTQGLVSAIKRRRIHVDTTRNL